MQLGSIDLGYLAKASTKLLWVLELGASWSVFFDAHGHPRADSSFVLSPDFSHQITQAGG